jgi:photosystem II stability/assembly factor-like uncharacterized protein
LDAGKTSMTLGAAIERKPMTLKATIAVVLLATLLTGCAVDRHAGELATNTGKISEIHMVNAHSGWAWSGRIGEKRLLLHTSDGGTTWRDVTPPGFSNMEGGCCFWDARSAWVPVFKETNSTNGLLRTTDAGKSWSLLSRPNVTMPGEVFSCRFFSSLYGIGQRSFFAGCTYVEFFETHDGGQSWGPIFLTPPQPVSMVFTNTFRLSYNSQIGGDRIVFYPSATTVVTYGDMADGQSNATVRLSVTTNLGKTWRDLELPLPSPYHNWSCVPLKPLFVDRKNAVLVARVYKKDADGALGQGAFVFYVSGDGGISWTTQPGIVHLDYSWQGSFDALSPKCFLVATETNVFATYNAARTWKSITRNISFGKGPDRGILQMDFVDSGHGWLVVYNRDRTYLEGNYRLYRTSNGGRTWTELPLRIIR